MKVNKIIIIICFLACFVYSDVRSAGPDISIFYDRLAPHGEWVSVSPYGWCWAPSNVEPVWRPYTEGHWVYTDYGWTFISDTEWAWAVYHYGRWAHSPEYGWIWVPGTDWGPAWVAWRSGGGYTGWAPLPPEIGFDERTGLIMSAYDMDSMDPFYWSFINDEWFMEPVIVTYIIVPARNETIIKKTRNVTKYSTENKKIINHGVDAKNVEKASGKKVARYKISEAGSDNVSGGNIKGGKIIFYQPKISGDKPDREPQNILPGSRLTESDLNQKHEAEKSKLVKHRKAHEEKLNKNQSDELSEKAQESNTEELKKRHRSEKEALEKYFQQESAILQKRHEREYDNYRNYHKKNN